MRKTCAALLAASVLASGQAADTTVHFHHLRTYGSKEGIHPTFRPRFPDQARDAKIAEKGIQRVLSGASVQSGWLRRQLVTVIMRRHSAATGLVRMQGTGPVPRNVSLDHASVLVKFSNVDTDPLARSDSRERVMVASPDGRLQNRAAILACRM